MNKSHLVIIPFYNEENYLEKCVDSIISQSLLPTKLILVDDNSSDGSIEVAKQFAKDYEWIEYYRNSSADKKEQGVKVIKAFNYGLAQVDYNNYDFISKLDADLEFPSDYFEKVLTAFKNKKIGLSGGKIQEYRGESWKVIPQASYHIRGALKTYRKECFVEIGGLMPVLGWDGLDEMKAFYYGWQSEIVDVPVKHFRPASSDYNPLELSKKKGYGAHLNGASFFMTFLRMIFKFKSKPRFKNGLYYMKGYLEARRKKLPKNVDNDLAKFINKFHFKRIFSIK